VFIGVSLFVSRIVQTLLNRFSHWLQKNNYILVVIRITLRYVTLRLSHTTRHWVRFSRSLLNSNNLAESLVIALQCAILV